MSRSFEGAPLHRSERKPFMNRPSRQRGNSQSIPYMMSESVTSGQGLNTSAFVAFVETFVEIFVEIFATQCVPFHNVPIPHHCAPLSASAIARFNASANLSNASAACCALSSAAFARSSLLRVLQPHLPFSLLPQDPFRNFHSILPGLLSAHSFIFGLYSQWDTLLHAVF